jgi:hypothetical protein
MCEECREIYRDSAAGGLGAQDMMAVIETLESRSSKVR